MNLDRRNASPERSTEFLNACILIVERDNASAEIMLHFLRSAGYRNALSIVGSGSVLDLLYELDIDLVLIDNEVLVTIDGSDILEQVRNNSVHRHLPIIVLTADDSRALRLRVLGQGANDILNKPVDAGEMKLRLQNTLAAKEIGRASCRERV